MTSSQQTPKSDSNTLERFRNLSARLLKSWYSPFVLGAFSLAITIFAWYWLRENQRVLTESEFSGETQQSVAALGQRATRLTATVDALEAFYIGSERIHSQEFSAFAQTFLDDPDASHSLQWIPRVEAEERQEFVSAAREDIRRKYQILEFGEDGKLAEAKERQEYFPIEYLEADSPTEIAHGFDWGSLPEAREALEAARDRAEPIITSPLDFPGDTIDEPRVFVFAPVYDLPRPPVSLDDRRERLVGFVAASARLPKLVHEVLREGEAAGARLYLVDVSSASHVLLYPTVETIEQTETLLDRGSHADRASRKYLVEHTFGVAGRDWQLLAYPTAAFISQRTRVQPSMVLSGGLALTTALVGLLLAMVNRGRTVSELVDERTEALARANQRLTTKTAQLEQSEAQLREAKRIAEHASQAKSELLAHLSHDLRTPLNAVIGFSSLLAGTELDDEQREYIETVEQSTQRLLEMVDQVLDVSQADAALAGGLRLFSLGELLEEACEPHRREAEDTGLSFALEVDPELPESFVGDPERMRKVVERLVENAVKFTDTGAIEVDAKLVTRDEGKVCVEISVRDTGIGVPEEKREAIYEPFSRVEQPMSRQFNGLGLGLAIAYRNVEQMGGKIWLESSVGEGSTFHFTAELALPTSEGGENEKAEAQQEVEGAPLRVLLVEDSEINRRLIMRLLSKKGHAISVAEDGQKAVELFEPGEFDVVLMDIQLPKMNGLEATSRIRQKEDGRGRSGRTPIIALTAQTSDREREEILDSGIDKYLPKPIDIGRLRELLGDLVVEHRGGSSGEDNSPVA